MFDVELISVMDDLLDRGDYDDGDLPLALSPHPHPRQVGGIMLGSETLNLAQGGEGAEQAVALGEGYFVIKLRGLPWGVTIEDIVTFLAPIPVPQGGVHLMNGANGRPSGLACVELGSEEAQKEALLKDK